MQINIRDPDPNCFTHGTGMLYATIVASCNLLPTPCYTQTAAKVRVTTFPIHIYSLGVSKIILI